MKIFLTGGRGFVGRQVRRALLARGHDVIGCGLDEDASGMARRHRPDLLDSSDVDEFLAKETPDGLVHLAWDTTPGVYWHSPANLMWTAASLRLLKSFANTGGRRVVIAGSSAEYRWEGGANLREFESPIEPRGLYGVSKDSLRRMIEAWAPDAGISLAWGRIFCPFGPHENKLRLIPRLIRQLTEDCEVKFDSGSLVRDFLHVEDLGDAFGALYDSAVEGPVNLASGQGLSIRQVASTLADTLGQGHKLMLDALPDPEGEPPRVVASNDRLTREVAWSPPGDTLARLSDACKWWSQQAGKAIYGSGQSGSDFKATP